MLGIFYKCNLVDKRVLVINIDLKVGQPLADKYFVIQKRKLNFRMIAFAPRI